jgi:hypothetical protein
MGVISTPRLSLPRSNPSILFTLRRIILKEIIYSAKARTIETLDEAITNSINGITDENALNWFQHCSLYFEPFRWLFRGTLERKWL